MADLKTLLMRRTSGGGYFPAIDGLRFVAIMSVLLYHVQAYVRIKGGYSDAEIDSAFYGQFLHQGAFGVQLFFVLSGLLLGLPFARHYLRGGAKVDLWKFFKRRVTRLEPPYLAVMIGLFLLLPIVTGVSWQSVFPNLLASLAYSHGALFLNQSVINTIAWSLEVEIQFYLLVPLFALIFRLQNRWARRLIMLTVGLVPVVATHFLYEGMTWLYWTLFAHLLYFTVGLVLADMFVTDWSESASNHPGWDVASVALLALAAASSSNHYVFKWILPIAFLVLVAAALRGVYLNRLLSNGWLAGIGCMCYSIYLLHFPLISLFGRATKGLGDGSGFWMHLALQVAVIVPLVLVASTIFYLLLEKPCMNPQWPQILWKRIFGREEAEVENGLPQPSENPA